MKKINFIFILIGLSVLTNKSFGQNIENYFPFKSIINFSGGIIRDKASISGNELFRLMLGDTVDVLCLEQKPFYKVSYRQTIGYLSESSFQQNDSLKKIKKELERIRIIEKRKIIEERKLKSFTKNIVGEAAPNFKLENLEGIETELSNYKGKIVLLEFWGAGCGPCIHVAKELQKINEYFVENKSELLIIEHGTLNVIDNIKKIIEKYNINNETLIGGKAIAEEYGVKAVPSFFLIDKNGFVIFSHAGSDLVESPTIDELFELIRNQQ